MKDTDFSCYPHIKAKPILSPQRNQAFSDLKTT